MPACTTPYSWCGKFQICVHSITCWQSPSKAMTQLREPCRLATRQTSVMAALKQHSPQRRLVPEVPSCMVVSDAGSGPARISPQGRLIKSVPFRPQSHRAPQRRGRGDSSPVLHLPKRSHSCDTFRAWKQGTLHADVPAYTRSQPGLASVLIEMSPERRMLEVADVKTQEQARHEWCTATEWRMPSTPLHPSTVHCLGGIPLWSSASLLGGQPLHAAQQGLGPVAAAVI